MTILRSLVAKLLALGVPYMARKDYREQSSFIRDNGDKSYRRIISYESFYNDYMKSLNLWVQTGKFE